MRSRLGALLVVVAAVPLAACDGCDNPATPDAGDDAGDSGICGGLGVFLTGEFVDWDSSAAAFAGISEATWTVRGEPERTVVTSPEGRIELCLPADGMLLVDVTPKPGSDYIGGVALVDKDVLHSGATYSVRSFKLPRAEQFGYATSRAHLYVRIAGSPKPVTVSAASDRAYAFDGSDWVPGENTGNDIYIANIDPAGNETKLEIPGVTGNPGTIPLAAGKLTFLVVTSP